MRSASAKLRALRAACRCWSQRLNFSITQATNATRHFCFHLSFQPQDLRQTRQRVPQLLKLFGRRFRLPLMHEVIPLAAKLLR